MDRETFLEALKGQDEKFTQALASQRQDFTTALESQRQALESQGNKFTAALAKLTQSTRPLTPPDEVEESIVQQCRKYMLYTLIMETSPGEFGEGTVKKCVTVARPHFALTAGHCVPKSLTSETPFKVYDNSNNSFFVRLFKRGGDDDDYAIVKIEEKEFPYSPPSISYAFPGLSYFILGYDGEYYEYAETMSCFKGTFRNVSICPNQNFIIGSPGTTSGCSGGGVFGLYGHLIGICVSGRLEYGGELHSPTDHQEIHRKLGEPSYSHIVPGMYLAAHLPTVTISELPEQIDVGTYIETRTAGSNGNDATME